MGRDNRKEVLKYFRVSEQSFLIGYERKEVKNARAFMTYYYSRIGLSRREIIALVPFSESRLYSRMKRMEALATGGDKEITALLNRILSK